MNFEQAKMWYENFVNRETVSGKPRDRPWDAAYAEMIYLAGTFYSFTSQTLGNWYETYLRQLMGAYIFGKKWPQYSQDYVPSILKDDPEILGEIRNRMLAVWNLPNRAQRREEVRERLDQITNYPELARFFLQNCTMMQNALNQRLKPSEQFLKRRTIEMHMGEEGLLFYLLGLLENVVQANLAKWKGKEGFYRQGHNNEWALIPQQNDSAEWKSAFPDATGPVPQMLEVGLDAREIFALDKPETMQGLENDDGFQLLKNEFESGGTRYKKIRRQLVQLCLMDNTFPEVTDDFFRYFAKQQVNLAEYRSFFDRSNVQAKIFTERLGEKTMTSYNWATFRVICSNTLRGVGEDSPRPARVQGLGFVPPPEPPGISVDSPIVIPLAIVCVLAFVIYNQ